MRALTGYDRVTSDLRRPARRKQPRRLRRYRGRSPADLAGHDRRRRRRAGRDLPARCEDDVCIATRCCARRRRTRWTQLASAGVRAMLRVPFDVDGLQRRIPLRVPHAARAELRASCGRRAVRAAVRDAARDRSAEERLISRRTSPATRAKKLFAAGHSSPVSVAAEFLEQLLLLGAQPGRRFDQDARDQVAAAAAVEHAHARAALAQLLARLDAGRDLDLDRLAVDARAG